MDPKKFLENFANCKGMGSLNHKSNTSVTIKEKNIEQVPSKKNNIIVEDDPVDLNLDMSQPLTSLCHSPIQPKDREVSFVYTLVSLSEIVYMSSSTLNKINNHLPTLLISS